MFNARYTKQNVMNVASFDFQISLVLVPALEFHLAGKEKEARRKEAWQERNEEGVQGAKAKAFGEGAGKIGQGEGKGASEALERSLQQGQEGTAGIWIMSCLMLFPI